jgi:hypothetical protein
MRIIYDDFSGFYFFEVPPKMDENMPLTINKVVCDGLSSRAALKSFSAPM